jgi:hypothetical protein
MRRQKKHHTRPLINKSFQTIRVSIPAPTEVGLRDFAPIEPRDVLTVEELEAFAAEIEDLVEAAQFRAISDRLTIDLERDQTSRRRVPPTRFRGLD